MFSILLLCVVSDKPANLIKNCSLAFLSLPPSKKDGMCFLLQFIPNRKQYICKKKYGKLAVKCVNSLVAIS